MRMEAFSTLCYLERDGKYLMLHRTAKKNDVNQDKWIGVGGHFEAGESPEECVLREVKEETGYTLTSFRFRGLLTFISGAGATEYISLFTADGFTGTPVECDEGTLEWVPKEEIAKLELWEGDKIFFRLLEENSPFFSLKLVYDGCGRLLEAVLDGRKLAAGAAGKKTSGGEGTKRLQIRNATMEDLEAIAQVEAECFPGAEAASPEVFRKRLQVFPNHFWLLEEVDCRKKEGSKEGRKLIGFVNGMVSREPLLRDEMYEDAGLHREQGDWQMIFGVNTLPEYRRKGYAAKVMRQVIADARARGQKGLVLTCKEEKLHYYEKIGFVNEGVSDSAHGGAVWYDMRLTF